MVPLSEVQKSTKAPVDVYRPSLPMKVREAASETAEELIGHGYGVKSLLGAAVDRLFNRPAKYLFGTGFLPEKRDPSKPLSPEAKRHCAEMVNDAYAMAGRPINEKPSYLVSPGELSESKGVKLVGELDFTEEEKRRKKKKQEEELLAAKAAGFRLVKSAGSDKGAKPNKTDLARYLVSGLMGGVSGAIGGVGLSSLMFPAEGNEVPEADRKRHARNRMLLGALMGGTAGAGTSAFATYGFDDFIRREFANNKG
jgi:hypothetical protein